MKEKIIYSSIKSDSDLLAKNLYRKYKKENDKKKTGKYDSLLLKWTLQKFWRRVIEDNIPVFLEVWKKLNEQKHTRKNKFVYGDYDVGLWVEYPKDKNKKVIISTRYCSCADDNTYIFILEKTDYRTVFRTVTVWPRQINSKYKHCEKGDKFSKDIYKPSLNTYRKADFKFGYYDNRDKGHVFLYEKYHFEKVIMQLQEKDPDMVPIIFPETITGEDIGTIEVNQRYIEDSLWTLNIHLKELKAKVKDSKAK